MSEQNQDLLDITKYGINFYDDKRTFKNENDLRNRIAKLERLLQRPTNPNVTAKTVENPEATNPTGVTLSDITDLPTLAGNGLQISGTEMSLMIEPNIAPHIYTGTGNGDPVDLSENSYNNHGLQITLNSGTLTLLVIEIQRASSIAGGWEKIGELTIDDLSVDDGGEFEFSAGAVRTVVTTLTGTSPSITATITSSVA